MRGKIALGAALLTVGYLVGGLEGLALAALAIALLAIPGRRSKKYVVRIVA